MSAASSCPAAATDRSTRCAPSSFWARAIRTMPSKSRASRRSRNFFDAARVGALAADERLGPDVDILRLEERRHARPADRPPACGFPGGTPSSALTRARMCSGVVPQHPPAIFRPGPVASPLHLAGEVFGRQVVLGPAGNEARQTGVGHHRQAAGRNGRKGTARRRSFLPARVRSSARLQPMGTARARPVPLRRRSRSGSGRAHRASPAR